MLIDFFLNWAARHMLQSLYVLPLDFFASAPLIFRSPDGGAARAPSKVMVTS